MATFRYRAFSSDGEPSLALHVREGMLPAQGHLLPVLSAIERCLASATPSWRLHLKIEGTPPFDVEFAAVRTKLAVVRFCRDDIDGILVVVAEIPTDVTMATANGIQNALEKIAPPSAVACIFDWVTGIPPPLAAMLHLPGPGNNGMDMLAMCVADRFLQSVKAQTKEM